MWGASLHSTSHWSCVYGPVHELRGQLEEGGGGLSHLTFRSPKKRNSCPRSLRTDIALIAVKCEAKWEAKWEHPWNIFATLQIVPRVNRLSTSNCNSARTLNSIRDLWHRKFSYFNVQSITNFYPRWSYFYNMQLHFLQRHKLLFLNFPFDGYTPKKGALNSHFDSSDRHKSLFAVILIYPCCFPFLLIQHDGFKYCTQPKVKLNKKPLLDVFSDLGG